MRRSAVAAAAALLAFAVPVTALAAEGAPGSDPMQGWRPPKVKTEKKDRAEIAKLFKAMETAAKKGDIEAATSLIDFPVLMLTDDSKGESHAGSWTKEQWVEAMEPFYKPMPDMKVKDNPTVFLLTDSLATVTNVATVTMGKQKPMVARNSMLLARVGGEWKVKAMVEGGWGDVMAGAPEGTAGMGQTSPSASPGASGTTTSEETTPPAAGQTTPPISDQPTSGQTVPPAGSEPPATGTK